MSKFKYYTPYNPNQYNYGMYAHTKIDIDSFGTSTEYSLKEDSYKFFTDNDYNILDSSLLVPGLRFSSPGLVVFERPPTKKLVQYVDHNLEALYELEEEGEEPEYHNYYIPIPWQVYIATYSMSPSSKYRVTSVRMYFSSTPLNHPDVNLYMPYVHNFFANGALCNPRFDTLDEIERYPTNLQGVISSAYDWVWNTGFNADLYECVMETVAQTINNNSIVSKLRENNKHLGSSVPHNFYTLLSNYDVHDVVNQPWANPSILSHFYSDRNYFITLADNYISANNVSNDEDEEFDSDDEETDALYSQTPYYQGINSPSSIVKTYSDIMNYVYDKNLNDYRPPTSSPLILNTTAFCSLIANSNRFSS